MHFSIDVCINFMYNKSKLREQSKQKGEKKMKELRKEIEKLVENEDFVSYEEFIYELEEEKEEVKKYLEWRANGGKMNTETLPDGYVEACKKILGGIENE